MAFTPNIRKDDWDAVRREFKKLYARLGPDSSPTFATLTITEWLIEHGGRDPIRYAFMLSCEA